MAAAASVPQGRDSYVKTNVSLVPENYSNQAQEPVSREDFERYCGLISDQNGVTVYYPPETASMEVKRTWIETCKKLEAEGVDMAFFKARIICQMKNAAGAIDLTTAQMNAMAKQLGADARACQDLFTDMLNQEKERLKQGAPSGSDPEFFRENTRKMIDAFQQLVDAFKKVA